MILLKESDFEKAALQIGCEIAAIKAVDYVESAGSGFNKDGTVKILFEGHKFWKQLEKQGIDPKHHVLGNGNILYQNWTRKHYGTGSPEARQRKEHARLKKAIEIDKVAALCSASWGRYQIMGYHFKILGYKDIFDMYFDFELGEASHLRAFVNYVNYFKLDIHLRNHNWDAFALGYNGRSYRENEYHIKLPKAYLKFKN